VLLNFADLQYYLARLFGNIPKKGQKFSINVFFDVLKNCLKVKKKITGQA